MKMAAALALLLLAAPALAQGRLAFATTTHDFGEVPEGEEPTYAFAFTNEGDRPLTLRSVQPACGCTTPSFTAEPVAPGGAGEIVVAYSSKGRPGPFRKSIRVIADVGAGAPAEQTLFITGDVVPETLTGAPQGSAVFDAEAHDLGAVPAGRAARHVFRMQNAGERPLRITEARSVPEGAEIAYPNAPVFAGDLVEILVVVVPEAGRRGPFDYALVLETDDAEQPTKSLRLTGTAE